jgi:ribosomal protein S18 acetylase RimI-like enzyme
VRTLEKISIRPFCESDATEIYAMLKDTEELHVGGMTYSEKAVQSWHVTRANDVILTAEVKGTIVGFIAAKLSDPEQGAAYIDCLVVKPNYRGRGIGQQLLQNCISSLKEQGVFFVNLHVRADFPRTINFWEKNQFKGKQPLLWMYKEV